MQKMGVQSPGQKDPLEKEQPTAVFLHGKPHGQKSLAGFNSWGYKRAEHDQVTKQQKQILLVHIISLRCRLEDILNIHAYL